MDITIYRTMEKCREVETVGSDRCGAYAVIEGVV